MLLLLNIEKLTVIVFLKQYFPVKHSFLIFHLHKTIIHNCKLWQDASVMHTMHDSEITINFSSFYSFIFKAF